MRGPPGPNSTLIGTFCVTRYSVTRWPSTYVPFELPRSTSVQPCDSGSVPSARATRSSAWRDDASISRWGSNETSQSGCRPNLTRSPAGNSWRCPARLPAMWSITTRIRHGSLPPARNPCEGTGERTDHDVPPPGDRGALEVLARRAVHILDRQRGVRHPHADPRAQDRMLPGHRNGRWNGRGRQPDLRGEPARDVRRRGQSGVALFLRIE